MSEAAVATGVSVGFLSLYERGKALPKESELLSLEGFYGPCGAWYPPTVAKALAPELRCVGCGQPLAPSARASRRRCDSCR